MKAQANTKGTSGIKYFYKYSGDYAREFGELPTKESRIWKVYEINYDGRAIGTLTLEPLYAIRRFRYEFMDGDYGSFNTRKELKDCIHEKITNGILNIKHEYGIYAA